MAMPAPLLLVAATAIYVIVGFLTTLFLLFSGLSRVDRSAGNSTLGFKILVFPGMVALWPMMLMRAFRGIGALPEESNAHRRAANANRGTPTS